MPLTDAVINTLITRINIPILGINGTRNLIVVCVFTYIASQEGSDIGTVFRLEKNASKTAAATRNEMPYEIIKTITENPRNTRLDPLLVLVLNIKRITHPSFFSCLLWMPFEILLTVLHTWFCYALPF